MKCQKGKRRRKRKRGRKVVKLQFDTMLALYENESFHTLAVVIQRKGIGEWRPMSDTFSDTLPMAVFRKHIYDEYSDIQINNKFDDIEFFFKALVLCPDYNPNETNKDGDTLLHLLCKTDLLLSVVEMLLERDEISVNIKNKFDCTPLDICIAYKNDKVKSLLLERGALTGDEVDENKKIEAASKETYASLEEYRDLKVNSFYPRTQELRRLQDPRVLEKKWI